MPKISYAVGADRVTWDAWADLHMDSYAARGAKRALEIPDPVPMAPPLGYIQQPSMIEQIQAMVRSESLRLAAEAAGAETFEESEDFEVEDFDPTSPYELHFDPVDELRRRREWERQVVAEADLRDLADNRARGVVEPEEAAAAPKSRRRAKAPPEPDNEEIEGE